MRHPRSRSLGSLELFSDSRANVSPPTRGPASHPVPAPAPSLSSVPRETLSRSARSTRALARDPSAAVHARCTARVGTTASAEFTGRRVAQSPSSISSAAAKSCAPAMRSPRPRASHPAWRSTPHWRWLPALQTLARDTHRERQLLESVARWVSSCSRRVSASSRRMAVLLEVRGSLRLFGGARTSVRTAARGSAESRCSSGAVCAHAHTARFAVVCTCRAGSACSCATREPAEPSGAIAACAAPAGRERSLADARARWACARSAIACVCRATVLRVVSSRRCSTMLDRAIGRLPDPRAAFRARANVRDPSRSRARDRRYRRASTRPARRCSTSCARFLRKRGRGVQAIELRFVHREAPPTRLRLRFVQPIGASRSASRSCCANDWRASSCRQPVRARAPAQRSAGGDRGKRPPSCLRTTAANPAQTCRNSSSACVPGSANRGRAWPLPACPSIARNRPGASRSPRCRRQRGTAGRTSRSRSLRDQVPATTVVAARRAAAARRRRTAVLRRRARARGGPRAHRVRLVGWPATSRATTTLPAIRPACACGCSATGASAVARALVPAWRVRLSRPHDAATMRDELRRAALPDATSVSCAAPRTRRNSSSARSSSAMRRSRSPTSARWPASCARTWRRASMRCQLIVGSEFRLEDGLRSCCSRPAAAATASSAA